ncbi:MAG: hypothetical protein ACE5DU_01815 [Nitrosopumilus sp.]
MSSKAILPILFGLLVVGFTQFGFAEEIEEITFIAVDEPEFEQPQSKYSYQEIIIYGHIVDYNRGQPITFVISFPDETQYEINTYATRNGDIYTLFHITNDSQIGVHNILLKINDEALATTSFEILKNQN